MTSRRHIGLVAGGATILAALPLSTIFQQWTWLVQCVITVVFVAGAATVARTLRAPAWAQLASMVAALLVILTFLTPDNRAILSLIPTADTFARFRELLSSAGVAMKEMGVPVSDHDGLLFLTALGIGLVAVCVDVCAVILRRPALAGLPMLAIYSVPVAVQQTSVSIFPFIAGAAGFLWLLVVDNVDRVRRFGRRFTGDGRDIDVWEPSPLAGAGRRMAILGVIVAIALPLPIPAMTTGLLDRFGTGGDGSGNGSGRGSGQQVNLWAMLEGTLKQDNKTEMLRVTTNDPNPGYLRFGTADELSVDGFRNRTPTGRTTIANLPDQRHGGSGVAQHSDKATVEVVNFSMRLLPVYSDPVAVPKGLDSKWLYDTRMQVIYSTSASTQGKRYEFDYVRAEYSPDALRRAQPLPPNSEIRRLNTPVPADEKVEHEVARLTAGKTTEYDKVRALYDFFSIKNNFTYSLDAKSDTDASAIDDFLDRRTGYCVQYAAALAWMVREAGIPARVAFGFTRGSKGENNTYSLSSSNLHAWTEVYFEGFGWVPFDATPSTFIAGSVDPVWAPNPDAPAATTTGVDPTPGADVGGQTNPNERDLGDNSQGGPLDTGADSVPNSTPPRWPWYAGAALLVLLLLAAPAFRRALLRRGRRPRSAANAAMSVGASGGADGPDGPGEPRVVAVGGSAAAQARHDAHAAWDELLDTLVDFRLPVDSAETPRATAERVIHDSSLRDDAARGARLLGHAEERARYARDPLQTGELDSALRSVRRAIAARAPRRIRIGAALLPRSVLIRWRQAVVSGSTGVVATTGRLWNASVRGVSPRRLLTSRGTR